MEQSGNQWPDGRLNDRFQSIQDELRLIQRRLDEVDGVKVLMAELRSDMRQMQGRMDRFREDTRDDFGSVHTEMKRISTGQTTLMGGILTAMIGAIVVLLVAL